VPWHIAQSRWKTSLPTFASAVSIVRGYAGARIDSMNALMSLNMLVDFLRALTLSTQTDVAAPSCRGGRRAPCRCRTARSSCATRHHGGGSEVTIGSLDRTAVLVAD
jgi:hypothetical protein